MIRIAVLAVGVSAHAARIAARPRGGLPAPQDYSAEACARRGGAQVDRGRPPREGFGE